MIEDKAVLNARSVLNTFILLKKAVEDPANAPPALIEACKSQGSLASLELDDHKIRTMSLNTMKTQANNNGHIQWKEMDSFRKATLKKFQIYVQNKTKPTRGSKAQLEEDLLALKQRFQQKDNEIIQHADRFDHLLSLCHDHAVLDPTLAGKFNKHLERFSHLDQWNVRLRLRLIYGGRDD